MNINTTLENNSLPTSGGTDTNNDGFMENLSIAGSSYSWMGQFDSTQIPDGTVYVHYIVFDQAGNASSYIQTAFVSNFAPSLASVTLGTDMNGNGQITGVTDSNSSPVETTAFSSGYTATNFVGRNNLLSFAVTSIYNGNDGSLTYTLTYNAGATNYWPAASDPTHGETVKGTSVTTQGSTTYYTNTLILDFTKLATYIPDAALNSGSFSLTVADAVTGSPTISQTINIGITNIDKNKPTITAAPFGLKFGTASTDASKTLGVAAYTDNISYSGSTYNGHVEYGSVNPFASKFSRTAPTAVAETALVVGTAYTITSLGSDTTSTSDFTSCGAASNAIGTNFIATAVGTRYGTATPFYVPTTPTYYPPALSGTVVFHGKVYDDHRISRITAAIPNFNGGNGLAAEFEVARWNPSGTGLLVDTCPATAGEAWTFAVDSASENVDLTNGHFLNWSLTWDTSQVTNCAQTNQTAVFKVYDFKYSGNASTITGASYTTTSLTVPQFSSMTSANGDAISVGDPIAFSSDGTTYTWTTVASVSGTTITVASSGNPYFILANSNSQSLVYDIAPYVTAVSTPLAKYYTPSSVFSRTAKGHYPVANNTEVDVSGFNLATTPNNPYVKSSATPITMAYDTTNQYLKFTPSTSTPSGSLYFEINSVPVLNNSNTNACSWNTQPNSTNNNLLTDDVIFDFWQFKEAGWSKSGSGINNPSMKVGPTGQVGFAFGHSIVYYSMPGYEYGGSTFYSETPFEMNYGWFTSNTFSYDEKGNTYGAALCPDTSGSPGYTANMNFFTRMSSGALTTMALNDNYQCGSSGNSGTAAPYAYRILNTSRRIATSTTAAAATTIANTNIYEIVSLGANPKFTNMGAGSNTVGLYFKATANGSTYPTATGTVYPAGNYTDIFRAQSPAVAAALQDPTIAASATNLANVYFAYYDEMTQEIRYRYGTVAGTATAPGAVTGLTDLGALTANSTAKGATLPFYATDIDSTMYQDISSTAISGSPDFATTTSAQPGNYLDLGYVPKALISATSDVVVIAWYSTNDSKLYFSYNTDPTNISGASSKAQWATNTKTVDSTMGCGQYVKLHVDSAGGIHMAYYSSSSGDLKYAYLPNYHYLTDSTSNSAAVATVDSFLTVGTNCTIDVAKDASGNQVPYISYSNSSIPSSARLAYETYFPTTKSTGNFDGATTAGLYTGNWEVTSIPLDSAGEQPMDAQVSVGVYRDPSTGQADPIPMVTESKLGDANTNGWLCSESCIVGGNGSSTVAVGYGVKTNKLLLALMQ